MTPDFRLVLLSPHRENHEELRRILNRSPWTVYSAWTVSEAWQILKGEPAVPVVLCARELADGDWKSVLGGLEQLDIRPILIVCDRVADERLWAEALHYGVFDVLSSGPFEADEVVRVMESARLAWNRVREERLHCAASR